MDCSWVKSMAKRRPSQQPPFYDNKKGTFDTERIRLGLGIDEIQYAKLLDYVSHLIGQNPSRSRSLTRDIRRRLRKTLDPILHNLPAAWAAKCIDQLICKASSNISSAKRQERGRALEPRPEPQQIQESRFSIRASSKSRTEPSHDILPTIRQAPNPVTWPSSAYQAGFPSPRDPTQFPRRRLAPTSVYEAEFRRDSEGINDDIIRTPRVSVKREFDPDDSIISRPLKGYIVTRGPPELNRQVSRSTVDRYIPEFEPDRFIIRNSFPPDGFRVPERRALEARAPERRAHDRWAPEGDRWAPEVDRRAPGVDRRAQEVDRRAPEVDRRAPDRWAPDNRISERRAPEERALERRAPIGRAPERRAPERRAPERRAPERRAPERRAPEERGLDRRSLQERSSNKRAPEDRITERRAPPDRAPDARVQEKRSLEVKVPEPEKQTLTDRAQGERVSEQHTQNSFSSKEQIPRPQVLEQPSSEETITKKQTPEENINKHTVVEDNISMQQVSEECITEQQDSEEIITEQQVSEGSNIEQPASEPVVPQGRTIEEAVSDLQAPEKTPLEERPTEEKSLDQISLDGTFLQDKAHEENMNDISTEDFAHEEDHDAKHHLPEERFAEYINGQDKIHLEIMSNASNITMEENTLPLKPIKKVPVNEMAFMARRESGDWVLLGTGNDLMGSSETPDWEVFLSRLKAGLGFTLEAERLYCPWLSYTNGEELVGIFDGFGWRAGIANMYRRGLSEFRFEVKKHGKLELI
ncbi:putative dynein heavy chain-like protein [Golovinomyces cichoracearum]|uniref:Putative dynein heavy chain-like protein n=1 Tax=Golovinomyces cichoracearum TaxID=62708 RepID=A0A420IG46_9PEZI|nr:putative dynein heavy chain-like protein [Golovinomyces cichoracearum]